LLSRERDHHFIQMPSGVSAGGLAASYGRIAGVQQAQGDLKAALKSYSDSLAIFERLEKFDPSNANWQRDLAASYERIAGVQQAQGDLKAALNRSNLEEKLQGGLVQKRLVK
jgi:tetratricopeptide (TPR) repeat protein